MNFFGENTTKIEASTSYYVNGGWIAKQLEDRIKEDGWE